MSEERDYYVTLINGRRVAWLAGPFKTRGEAAAVRDRAWKLAEQIDPWAHFYVCGTGSRPHVPWNKKGVLNAQLGVDTP